MIDVSQQGIWYHVVTVSSLVAFKLAVLLVGYLIARLGYELLIKGVTGEFKFRSSLGNTTADLVSASPGIFFILMASVLIAIAIVKDKPFGTTVTTTTTRSGAEAPMPHDTSSVQPSLPSQPGMQLP